MRNLLNKTPKKIWIGVVVLLIILITLGIFKTLEGVNAFFESNRFVFHRVVELKINPPFTIEQRIISPIPTEEPKKTTEKKSSFVPQAEAKEPVAMPATSADIKTLMAFVHMRESGNGTARSGHHVTCREQGMWNEIGFAPQSGFCFASEAEGMARLEKWFEDNLPAGIARSLCKYNTGQGVSDCKYYQDYLAFSLK